MEFATTAMSVSRYANVKSLARSARMHALENTNAPKKQRIASIATNPSRLATASQVDTTTEININNTMPCK